MSDEREAKMVIVARKEVLDKARKGKCMGQGGHAASTWMIDRCARFNDSPHWSKAERQWMFKDKQSKVVLQAKDLAEIEVVKKLFEDAGIQVYLIVDAGKTEFDGPTETCLAVGPDWADEIDKITGKEGSHPLKLY
jgi:peptidyl-tRNA hydrolase, PTH2 family